MSFLDGWRFCPRCGAGGEHRGTSFACPGCGYEAWANSVPGVHALIERDGRILLGGLPSDLGPAAFAEAVSAWRDEHA